MKVSIIVLARNELKGIQETIPKLKQLPIDEIVVVDGNSTDGTFEECKKMGIKVIKQKSIGRGNAFREGLRNSTGDVLVFFSPDGNENPDDIPKLISKISEGYDLVIASRFSSQSGSADVTAVRKIANNLTTKVINTLFHGSYTDACNGFRVIKRSAMEKINTDAKWFEIEIQISMRCLKEGFKVTEIPTFEGERVAGGSNLNLFTTGLRHGWYILRELFH
ncbi:MAG: glycosyltransferase family 2 protein [Nitrosotalea sp.]